MEYLKVNGYEGLFKDPNTNNIVNTNMSEYENYIARRETKNKETQKIQGIEEDVANMKDDLNEIKFLLRSLIDGSKWNTTG